MKDVVIIGGGPAGLSAAVYAKRATLDVLLLEKSPFMGGQIINTEKVDNYLGLNGISGFELAMKYKEHVENLDVESKNCEVKEIKVFDDHKEVVTGDGECIKTKNIIIATGAGYKHLNVPREKELTGSGVSYCATCDGAFFRNRDVAVIGGGNVALEDALYLSNVCSKVYLINRREELRGAKDTQEKIFASENVEFIPNYTVKELVGEHNLQAIILKKTDSDEEKEIQVSGVFVAIGMEPATDFVKNIVDTDDYGYIIAGEDGRTSIKGIYAVGDCRTKKLRQLVTAVADGAYAVSSIKEDNY